MRHWLKDGPLRSVLRNAGYLGSTKIIGAVFGIVALSCAGRALGPETFGILTLIHTYALGANALTNFQSWQVVIRYGAPALAKGDEDTAGAAISLSLGLDIASGLVGMVAGMLLLPLLAARFGISGDWVWAAIAYCTIVPSMASATPTGILRMLDRFDLIALQQPATPLVRCALAVAALWAGLGLPGFVVAWYVADLVGDAMLWVLAVRELSRRDMLRHVRPGLRVPAARLPGAWHFVWTTNMSTSLGAGWGPVGNLMIGALLGPAAAGVYKVASTLLDAAGKPADMLSKGFYPEIMRLDPHGPEPWRLALRSGAISGAVGIALGLVVVLAAEHLIDGIFGHRYLPAAGLLSVMTLALAVSMATFPFQSLLYMAGRQMDALAAQAVATGIYLVTLAALCVTFGLAGAAIAYVIGNVAVSILMGLYVHLAHVRLRGRAATGRAAA